MLRANFLLASIGAVYSMATRATPAPRMQTTAETPTASYPLHEAAATGNADEADLLLLAGLDANTRNARSSTPLHLAAVKGHGNIAVVLLAHGASANAANEGGNTPLHAAVEAGELEIAELLLESRRGSRCFIGGWNQTIAHCIAAA